MNGSEQVRGALQALADANNGRLTPDGVIEAARDPSSPLHEHFQWDVAAAAVEHWRNQARGLIRSVVIEVRTTHFVVSAPAFIRDPEAGRAQGYIASSRLRNDADAAREAVISEFARASAALARAKSVALILGLADEVREIEGRIIDMTERARVPQENVVGSA